MEKSLHLVVNICNIREKSPFICPLSFCHFFKNMLFFFVRALWEMSELLPLLL